MFQFCFFPDKKMGTRRVKKRGGRLSVRSPDYRSRVTVRILRMCGGRVGQLIFPRTEQCKVW